MRRLVGDSRRVYKERGARHHRFNPSSALSTPELYPPHNLSPSLSEDHSHTTLRRREMEGGRLPPTAADEAAATMQAGVSSGGHRPRARRHQGEAAATTMWRRHGISSGSPAPPPCKNSSAREAAVGEGTAIGSGRRSTGADGGR
jgi:hypothetical protein